VLRRREAKTAAQISFNMSRVKASGSLIERTLGSAMWGLGLRYRKQYRSALGRPDFAFPGARVAVFCDSSFWHGRGWPDAAQAIQTNRSFWIPKIERNIARDLEVNAGLSGAGWLVVRFWDDEILSDAENCAKRVLRLVRKRTK